MTFSTPRFDETNRRFPTPTVCPNPVCGQPVKPINYPEAVGWCTNCEQPFEVVRMAATEGAPIQLHRRPHSAFCTQTGQKLDGYSLVDWPETGGGPGRSHCVEDPYGGLFGAPDSRFQIKLRQDSTFEHDSVLPVPDDNDWVSALAVVRGRLVAVTALGRMRVFDIESGVATHNEAIDWSSEISTSTEGYQYQVRFTPAFRGSRMVMTISHQAQFRDLRPFLFRGDPADSRPKMVEPEKHTHFLGPPLGLEYRNRPAFCLLQGRVTNSSIEDAHLRFFTVEGETIGRCEAPEIVRPPIFDRRTGHLAWITREGSVVTLAASDLADGKSASRLPAQLLNLGPEDRPLLIAAAAPRTPTRTELWVAHQDGGTLILYRVVLDDLLEGRDRNWAWSRQKEQEKLGNLVGFAVGIGSSRYAQNAAGQLIGVTTLDQAVLWDRSSTDTDTHPIPHGSYDPPILSSAGMIARTKNHLYLDYRGTGWGVGKLHPDVPMSGEYHRAQGLVQYGRRIILGHGLGLQSFHLEPVREDWS